MNKEDNSNIVEEEKNKNDKKEVIVEAKIVKASKEEIKEANELKDKGNQLYKSQDYKQAYDMYTRAIELLTTPKKIVEILEEGEEQQQQCNEEVAVYHSNRAAASHMDKEYERTIQDTTEALSYKPTQSIMIKCLNRRAQCYDSTERPVEALADFRAVLVLDSKNDVASKAEHRLIPIVKAKEDKEREEMMGKLKDLGNTILGKFGLSTNNFQFVKDQNSGGYSVNFKQ
eukprot:gene14527-17155_t